MNWTHLVFTLAIATPAAVRTAQPSRSAQQQPASPAPTRTAQQVVDGIQAFYDRTTDFDADFVQQRTDAISGRVDARQGHVRFLKPGRMRWDYARPSGDVIVSDGTTVNAYEAAGHQVFQTPLSQSQLPSALAFLMGRGRIADDFTFRLVDPNQYRYPNGYVLELRPRQPNASFDRIIFYVEPQNFQVVRIAIIDSQGNVNRIDFNNPRVNLHPPQTAFQWTPPPGTQIVRP